MLLLSCSGTGRDIYAKLANGMARYNCARASPTRNSSVLRSLARRQQAQYPQVTHRQGSGRMTGNPEIILLVCRSVDVAQKTSLLVDLILEEGFKLPQHFRTIAHLGRFRQPHLELLQPLAMVPD